MMLRYPTITVSPSKSAPDNILAVVALIPIASNPLAVIISLPSLFLLLTLQIGISKVPP